MAKGKGMSSMYAIAMLSPVLAENGTQMVPFESRPAPKVPSYARMFLEEVEEEDDDDVPSTPTPAKGDAPRKGTPERRPTPPTAVEKPDAGPSPRRQPAKAVLPARTPSSTRTPTAGVPHVVPPCVSPSSAGSTTSVVADGRSLVQHEDIARVVAEYLSGRDFCTMLRVSQDVRDVWNAQTMWKVIYLMRGGDALHKTRFADFRGRCKLLLASPAQQPLRDTSTPDSDAPRPPSRLLSASTASPSKLLAQDDEFDAPTTPRAPQNASAALELTTDELLRNLDALDSNTSRLEEWVRKEARDTVDQKVRRKASGEGAAPRGAGGAGEAEMDFATRKELYRKELKASCDATPLQRMCDHMELELNQTIDPVSQEVTCATCGVRSVMKIRGGVAVICGFEIGPIRRTATSAPAPVTKLKGGKTGRPALQADRDPAVRVKPQTASATVPASHLPPLAKKRGHGAPPLGPVPVPLFANRTT